MNPDGTPDREFYRQILKLNGNAQVFTSVAGGIVPASGGGTTNYLRADGTWTDAALGGGAGGDLGATYPNPTVLKVHGITYPGTAGPATVPVSTGSGAVNYTPTSQLPGTITNDSATTGNIGEYISSGVGVGGAVPLSTGMAADVTSLALSAGDWTVAGNVVFYPGVTTAITELDGAISGTSATLPTSPGAGGYARFVLSFTAGQSAAFPVGQIRLSLAAPASVFLVAQAAFSLSTLAAGGFIGARRAR